MTKVSSFHNLTIIQNTNFSMTLLITSMIYVFSVLGVTFIVLTLISSFVPLK